MLKYLVEPRTQALPAEGPDQYGVALHGLDTYWHRVTGPNFVIDLGNWPTRQEAQAFVQHLEDNGPAQRARDVEYVVVDERLLGYRAPPDKDATFSTVQVLFEPGRGLLNNQQPVQHGFNQVRPATPTDFEHYRVHLGSHEKDLTRPLEALARNYPVMVAGTLYKPTTPESAMKYYTAGKDDLLNGRMAPRVAGWEIWQYLVSGKLTPQLAAGAVENLHKLDVFDRASMLNFAEEARRDPGFTQFRSYEAAYYHAMSDAITQGAPIRDFGLKDLSFALNQFVRNARFDQPVTDKIESHLMLAQRFLDAIAAHPATQEFRKTTAALPNMTASAMDTYGDILLRNNPDLSNHYAEARERLVKVSMLLRDGVSIPPGIAKKIADTQEKINVLSDYCVNRLLDVSIAVAPQNTIRKP
jgi:hypothetical protein